MRAPQRAGLLAPLTGFLLVFFVLPLGWLLSLAVREAEVPRALPRTLVVLADWSPPQAPPPAVFPALAQDLVAAGAAPELRRQRCALDADARRARGRRGAV